MQVEMQKKIIRVFISKFEIPDWQVVRESIVIQLRSTGVRKVHVNGAREHKLPAAGIFSKIHEKENTDGRSGQVLSMYLSCSGYEEITNACLDRVVCEYANEESEVEQEERDVISMWVSDVL